MLDHSVKQLVRITDLQSRAALSDFGSEMLRLAPTPAITGTAGQMLERLARFGPPPTRSELARKATHARRRLRFELKAAHAQLAKAHDHCETLTRLAEYLEGKAALPGNLDSSLKAAAVTARHGIEVGSVDRHLSDELRDLALKAAERISEAEKVHQRTADTAALAQARQTVKLYRSHRDACGRNDPEQAKFAVSLDVARQVERERHRVYKKRYYR